jgi:hypothetical protein
VNGAEVWFGLGIVGYGDESAAAGGTVGAVATVRTVVAAVATGRSHTAGTSTAAATTFSTGASAATVGFHGEGASLRVNQIKLLLTFGGDAYLQQRMGA